MIMKCADTNQQMHLIDRLIFSDNGRARVCVCERAEACTMDAGILST
jgi:hypothetical protein